MAVISVSNANFPPTSLMILIIWRIVPFSIQKRTTFSRLIIRSLAMIAVAVAVAVVVVVAVISQAVNY
jgi:hypothetical protein